MKLCNNCGTKIDGLVNFCTECGAEIGTVNEGSLAVEAPGDVHD